MRDFFWFSMGLTFFTELGPREPTPEHRALDVDDEVAAMTRICSAAAKAAAIRAH
jgi:hypothetical protein